MDRAEVIKECQAIVWEMWSEGAVVPSEQECLRNAYKVMGEALQASDERYGLATCTFWLITAAGRDAEVVLPEIAPDHPPLLDELSFWVALLLMNHSIGRGIGEIWQVAELISLYPGLNLAEMLRKRRDSG